MSQSTALGVLYTVILMALGLAAVVAAAEGRWGNLLFAVVLVIVLWCVLPEPRDRVNRS